MIRAPKEGEGVRKRAQENTATARDLMGEKKQSKRMIMRAGVRESESARG